VRLISQADPFAPGDIPQVKTRIYHLGGLFLGEIPNALIEYLQPKGKIALDMQAMLRSSENAEMEFKDWAEKEQYLSMVTYLKADSLESEVTTGITDREKAATLLHGWGAKEVMITHSSEVIVYNGKKMFRAPFNPRDLSGRTEEGTRVSRAYLAWRLSHGIERVREVCSGSHEHQDGKIRPLFRNSGKRCSSG